MRELDRIAVVGAGRLGSALGSALRAAGLDVDGPLRRGQLGPADATLVLLCVPDGAIGEAAAAIAPGPVVGHCSGATTLEPITSAGHTALSVHPLMTVPAGGEPARAGGAAGAASIFAGAGAAVAGSTPASAAAARALAERIGLRPVEVDDADRAAYHAAASVASNFLVTLEGAAERLAATAGVPRELLVPLVRATVENWAALGAERALTGPIARGDEATVERHREAIAERAPDLLALYDGLAEATRAGAPA